MHFCLLLLKWIFHSCFKNQRFSALPNFHSQHCRAVCQLEFVVHRVGFNLLHALSTPFGCKLPLFSQPCGRRGMEHPSQDRTQNWYKPSVYLASCCCHSRLMSSLHFPFLCSMSIVIPIWFSARPCPFSLYFSQADIVLGCCVGVVSPFCWHSW